MKLIDSHAHVNFKAFKDDGDQVIQSALENNTWMILVGVEYKTSKLALNYANKYSEGVYASVGLHPIHTNKMQASDEGYNFFTRGENFDYASYEKLTDSKKVVAIGETGLDYYHISKGDKEKETKAKQQEVFLQQLKLADKKNLPVIIHSREAHHDTLEILKEFRRKHKKSGEEPWGVMHCFSGDEDLAWEYFGLGLLISFTGLVTFVKDWDNLIRRAPLDKILIETDSPFMTPEPLRSRRNEPKLVIEVAKRIAELKDYNLEKIANITTNNAKKLFNI